MTDHLRRAAREIFAAALRAVDVREAVRSRIHVQDGALRLGSVSLVVKEVDEVLIVAIGKAAVPMYQAASEALSGLPHRAVVVAPQETIPANAPPFFLPGEHPTPGANSARAASEVLQLLASAGSRSAVLFLISGGASAMVEQPLDASITQAEMAAFHRALVASGLDITQMNALRKHLSAVKGGRLAVAAAAARAQHTLLISDVPAAAPDAIGSGPSLPDSTTVTDCRRLFARLQASAPRLPQAITHFFKDEALPETPKATDLTFARATWQVILSSDHLASAAMEAAQAAGFYAEVDNTCDDWEYREAARYLLDRAASLPQRPACLVSVGEIAVSVDADHGEGGRNSQFALWCAAEITRRGLAATVLSAGSDGIDGHSYAAGAVCDETSVTRAAAQGLDVDEALSSFNTAPLLRALGDDIMTGPTGNNLRDLRLILLG